MNKPRILVIEDDAPFRALLCVIVREHGCDVLEADSAERALDLLPGNELSAIFLDLCLPGMTGLDFLRRVHAMDGTIPVVVLTGQSSIPSAILATRLGAYDYLVKPPPVERMALILSHLIEVSTLKRRVRDTTAPHALPLIGTSAAMQGLLAEIRKVAPFDVTVLIEGESGTGKELVTRQIHAQSLRAAKPCLVIDCGALTETLITSELFGHERGSFTGADEARPGLFERADGGTVFLDEIEALPMALQPKLLRVLESKEVLRVGGRTPVRCNVRVIAAANRDLRELTQAGEFRADLYHRLCVFKIVVPPLRSRGTDIELLARYFAQRYSMEFSKPVENLTPEAIERLRVYDWPGNVRELANTMQRAVLMASTIVDVEALPPEIATAARAGASAPSRGTEFLRHRTASTERETILKALQTSGYNKMATARLLGIDVKTLYNKLKKHGIEARAR